MHKVLFIIIITLLQSCLKDDIIKLEKVTNNSNKLKINGYFISSDEFGQSPYFFYSTGLALRWASIDNIDTLNYENQFLDIDLLKKIKGWKYSWGLYQIINEEILIERWYPSDRPYDAFLTKGKILNDTTFTLTEFSEPDRSKKKVINEVYRFKRFSPKPDSTNIFIK